MVQDVGYYWRHPEDIAALHDSRLVAHPFSAKVALAALGDGECRASTALGYLFGVTRGLSMTEVRGLLGGSAAHATAGEAPAVLFARHYRLTEGLPDPGMVLSLVEAYGQEGANDLLRYLRLLLLVLRISRSFDALAARLVGRPRGDSTLRGELVVVWVSLVGLLPLLPLLRWRAPTARRASQRRVAAAPMTDSGDARPLDTPLHREYN